MNAARRNFMLFEARCNIRTACTLTDKNGVAHGLSPAETVELLQTVHSCIQKNQGYDDFAESLLQLIVEFDAELNTCEPEIEAFRTLGPTTLDRVVERV